MALYFYDRYNVITTETKTNYKLDLDAPESTRVVSLLGSQPLGTTMSKTVSVDNAGVVSLGSTKHMSTYGDAFSRKGEVWYALPSRGNDFCFKYVTQDNVDYNGFVRFTSTSIQPTYDTKIDKSRGSFVSTTTANDGYYPSNGVSGSYWYIRRGKVPTTPKMMVKVSGTTREPDKIYVKVNGVSREVEKMYVKVSGVSREVDM